MAKIETRYLPIKYNPAKDVARDLSLSPRNQLLKRAITDSRRGPYVDIDALRRWRPPDKAEKTFARDLKNDFERRIALIEANGDDSIGHLALSGDTLSAVLRLSEFSFDVDLKTIEGIRSVFSKGGCEVIIRPGYPIPLLKSGNVKELKEELAEHDRLAGEH